MVSRIFKTLWYSLQGRYKYIIKVPDTYFYEAKILAKPNISADLQCHAQLTGRCQGLALNSLQDGQISVNILQWPLLKGRPFRWYHFRPLINFVLPDISANIECARQIQTVILGDRWKVCRLLQDGGGTDFFYILGDCSLKQGLLIGTAFNPCLFSLDNTFMRIGLGGYKKNLQFAKLQLSDSHQHRLRRLGQKMCPTCDHLFSIIQDFNKRLNAEFLTVDDDSVSISSCASTYVSYTYTYFPNLLTNIFQITSLRASNSCR